MRAWSASSSMRISPTACSSSVCVTPRNLSMRGRRLPSQALRRRRERRRPRRRRRRAATCRGRLAAPSRRRTRPASCCVRPARRSPGRRVRTVSPGRALSIRHGPKRTLPSSRTSSYSRTARTPPPRSAAFVPSVDASSESSALRASRGRRGRSSASASRFRSAPGWRRRRSGRISSRMSPRFVSRVRRVDAVLEAVLLAVADGVVAPQVEERSHDAVLALRLDASRVSGRHEAIENGLDLVGRGVPRRPKPEPLGRLVPDRAQLGLGRPRDATVANDDRRPERVPAEGGVGCRLRTAQAVIHVDCGDAVPELAQDVPQARRVRLPRRRGTSRLRREGSARADGWSPRRARRGRSRANCAAPSRGGLTRRRPARPAARRSRPTRRSPTARTRARRGSTESPSDRSPRTPATACARARSRRSRRRAGRRRSPPVSTSWSTSDVASARPAAARFASSTGSRTAR